MPPIAPPPLVQRIPVGIFQTDAAGSWVFVNARWAELAGRSPAQALRAGWVGTVHPDDRDRVVAAWRAATDAAQPFHSEHRLRAPDGRITWVRADASPQRDERGRYAGHVGALTEISRPAQDVVHATQQVLHRLHAITSDDRLDFDAQLNAVLDLGCAHFDLPVGILSRIGGDTYEVLASRGGEIAAGAVFPLGETCSSLTVNRREPLHAGDVDRTYIGVAVRVDGRVLGTLDFSGPAPRDAPFTATDDEILKGMARWVGGAISRQRVAEALRDAERRYLQAQKMEAIGRLASGIAHDFKNLLTGILGCADIAARAAEQHRSTDPSLRMIRTAAGRGVEIARQLLDFSRKRDAQLRPIDLGSAIRSSEGLLRRLFDDGVTVVIDLTAEKTPVLGDPGYFDQILLNLAINARDAMPEGGRLALTTRRVRADGVDQVLLEVQDTGIGMDARTQARAFEPFFTTKGPGIGTGLGLATVYSIVNQLQGTIAVDSAVGVGTAFRLRFPLSASPVEAEAPVFDVARTGGRETILVVDQEEIIRATARFYLEESGYRVLEADGPQAALALCAAPGTHVDLLLTDIVMPERSGPELAREARRGQPGLKVLLMSAHPTEVLVREGRLAAGMPALEKPFSERALTHRVRELLDED